MTRPTGSSEDILLELEYHLSFLKTCFHGATLDKTLVFLQKVLFNLYLL